MIGRNYNNGTAVDYRFGFNGKENDNEVKGEGNQIDFGERIYDGRIGRWLSVDPIIKPYESPISAFGNNPILFVDPDGKDNIVYLYAADNSVSMTQLKSIAKHANANFKSMGLKTEVRIIKGNFDKAAYSKLQKTDAIAIIGQRDKVIEAATKVDASAGKFLKDNGLGRNGFNNEYIPEVSDHPNGPTERGNIIGLATDATASVSKSFNVSFEEGAGFLINHGAGHNASLEHAGRKDAFDGQGNYNQNGFVPDGPNVMSDQNEIKNLIKEGGSLNLFITSLINQQKAGEDKQDGSPAYKSIKDAFIGRFGDRTPTETIPTVPNP